MITCDQCGRTNADSYRFCMGCGAKLAHPEPPPQPVKPKPAPVVERPAVLHTPSIIAEGPLDTQQVLDDFYDAMGRLHAAALKLRHASTDPDTQRLVDDALAEHLRWFASINADRR